MIEQGIKISWSYCTEYVPIDIEQLDGATVATTMEVLRCSG